MADRPRTQTQPLNRAQITEWLGGNPRMVRWFESFVRDLSEILPDAAQANSVAAEAAQVAAHAARIVADEALALAEVQELAHQLLAQVNEQRDRITELSRLLDGMMERNYSIRHDQDANPPTLAYVGRAEPGAAESAAAWQVQKLVFGIDGDVAVTWADGNAAFDNIWDDRASLSYS